MVSDDLQSQVASIRACSQNPFKKPVRGILGATPASGRPHMPVTGKYPECLCTSVLAFAGEVGGRCKVGAGAARLRSLRVNSVSGSLRAAIQPPKQVVWLGASSGCNRTASRLFQFLCSFLKVAINRSSDQFGKRSACLVGQLLQFLDLLLLEEECCPFHRHMIL